MATFAYSGKTRAGEMVSGERVADDMDAAVAALRRDQVMVTKITPAKAAAKAEEKKKTPGGGRTDKTVSPKNLAVFVRQFSVMIDAGLPLVQCLDILGNQEEDKNFAEVILQTRSAVEGGAALADAMKRFPNTFDPLYTNMIAAGEAGGILDTILKRLSVYIEKAVKLKGQVQAAMIYPIAVIVIAGLVVGVILWKVIPTFAAMFEGLGAELPLPTRIVIGLSNNLVRYAPFVIPLLGLIGYAFKQYYSTDGERHHRRRHHVDAQEHRARRDDLRAPARDGDLPGDGLPDDQRRRGHGRARCDAREDRRLLRRRSRPGRGRHADAPRADHDRVPRRRRRRHRHRDVHADLR